MRLKEQRLWDTMRRRAPRDVWINRVENVVLSGMPDLFVVSWKKGTWVELKAPTRPKKASTRLLGDEGLNVDQVNWHLRAKEWGLDVYTLIRDSEGELFLVHNCNAHQINEFTLAELRQRSLASDWETIFRILS